jgi:hypothetical protein
MGFAGIDMGELANGVQYQFPGGPLPVLNLVRY